MNVGGGRQSARSLAQLSAWCRDRLGEHRVEASPNPRPFDIPWMILDAATAREVWGWTPERTTDQILDEILQHANDHPEWLGLTGDG